MVVLGIGLNPGFLMDYLPLVMAGIVYPVKSVKVLRYLGPAARRRSSFRRRLALNRSRA